MNYVHLKSIEAKALVYLRRSKRRTVGQLARRLGVGTIETNFLLRNLCSKGLVRFERVPVRGGMRDGTKLTFIIADGDPDEVALMFRQNATRNALSSKVVPTYRWLRGIVKHKRAKELLKMSGIWETRCKEPALKP